MYVFSSMNCTMMTFEFLLCFFTYCGLSETFSEAWFKYTGQILMVWKDKKHDIHILILISSS